MKKMKILMCGHTGGRNRGCEAIIRTTNELLDNENIDSEAMTFDLSGDKNVHLDNKLSLISYPQKSTFVRGISFIKRKLFKDEIWGASFYHRDVIKNNRNYNAIFNVGGDTYCYGMPWISISMNMLAEKFNCPTIFWGCSIDETLDNNKVLQEDINRYDYIVTRESYSYEILKRNYKNKKGLYLACDPAFHLKPVEIELPKNFQIKNTLGINISPVMVDMKNLENSMVYKNCINLINHVLETSDMSVCLIPHVYQINPESRDYIVLKKIYSKYADNSRVILIDKEYSAGQLKFIISNCRYFIGSRTHSIIAAYSSGIPAIALSYSIKSRGLANDVMGQEKGYSISWKSLTSADMLKEYYEKYLVLKEEDINERLEHLLPEYKQSIVNVIRELKSHYEEE